MCVKCYRPPAVPPKAAVCSQCHFFGTCWVVGRDEPWCFRCIAFVLMRIAA